MSFFLPQPSVPDLPSDMDLSSRTALITGPTSGIGLATAHALLSANLTTLILGARSESKANALRHELLAAYPHAKIEVLALDTSRWESVQAFCAAVAGRERPGLDMAFLNAGVQDFGKQRAATGHDRMLQVNYLSNVALTLGLMPLLASTAAATGRPSRLTWTSTRLYDRNSLGSLAQEKEPLFAQIDAKNAGMPTGYINSKFLGLLFCAQAAGRVPAGSVVVNSFCPGTVETNFESEMPAPIRWVIRGIKKVTGRPAEVGGRIAVNAGVVAGEESHGGLLTDMNLSP